MRIAQVSPLYESVPPMLYGGTERVSGWGIRTLATVTLRCRHNGTVWPHDNALIAAGLARYGLESEASVVLTALFDG